MANSQVRLTRLEIENSEDSDLVAEAQSRIAAREETISRLKAQILVDKSLQNGSLRKEPFTRLRKDIALRNVEAMKCQLCQHKPDDPVLKACGHIYCEECYSKVWPGRCRGHPCKRRLRKRVRIDEDLFEAICTMFKITFTEDHDEEEDTEASEDEVSLSSSKRPRSNGRIMERADSRPLQLRSQIFQSYGTTPDEELSEDDGFDNRSQRSTGYDDDGNSFVSDDEIVDMAAEFEKASEDSTTEDEDKDILMGSEEEDE